MSSAPSAKWLLRIPEVFAAAAAEILEELGATAPMKLGKEYHLVTLPGGLPEHSGLRKFVRWNLPVEHAWPCHPQKMEGFIEKAAQGLFRKFGDRAPQTILAGPLQAGAPHPYYKHLATNLRGRTLQLFPKLPAAHEVEAQDPELPTLFCLVGKEGLYAGMQSPRASNGFHPGGTRFISQSAETTISRAGAKIAEALHYLRLYRPPLPAGAHWLELGASPGGMTSELLTRGYRVTAVDKAALDPRLRGAEGLQFVRTDVDSFRPLPTLQYDALLCDMNGDARQSLRQVVRLAPHLVTGGLVVFTLKAAGADSVREIVDLSRAAASYAEASGLTVVATTHLTYNRQEFTLFLERR